MPKLYLDKNIYTILPPLSDWLEEYIKAHLDSGAWQNSNQKTARMALRRFDQWLAHSGLRPEQVTWTELHSIYDFLKRDGITNHGCRRVIAHAKMALRWAIENKSFPQKLTDIFPANVFRKHQWTQKLLPEMEEFLDELTTAYTLKAIATHRQQLRIFSTFLQKNKINKASTIDRNTIVKFMQFLNTTSFTQQTRYLVGVKIRVFTKWLCAKRILVETADNVFPPALIPKRPLHHPRPIDLETDKKIIAYCRSSDDFYMKALLLMRLTGIRYSELAALPKDCISCDSEGRHSMLVPAIKSSPEHFIPLSDETRNLIDYFTKVAGDRPKLAPTAPLVVRPDGAPISHRDLHNEFHALLSQIRIKKWLTPHALRHTFASSMLDAGLSLQSLQYLLGHKTIIMTLQYARLSQNRIKEEYARAVDLIKSHHATAIPIDDLSVEGQLERLISLVKAKMTGSKNRTAVLKTLSKVKSLCQSHS